VSRLHEINLRDLTRTVHDTSRAKGALKLLRAWTGDLNHALRHHFPGGVRDRDEILLRDSLDELLGFYGLLEIAAQVEFVPDPLPAQLREDAIFVLSEPAVRRYYEETYPLVLPRVFLGRLERRRKLREESTGGAVPLFMQMLDLRRVIETDGAVGFFLKLLDDYRYKLPDGRRLTLRLVLNVIKDPAVFLEHIAETTRRNDRIDSAVLGFSRYLRFATQFHALLERAEDLPLLQSSMWHDQGYWFESIGKTLHGSFVGALHDMLEWKQEAEIEGDSIEAAHDELRLAVKVFDDLCGGKYGQKLRDAAGL